MPVWIRARVVRADDIQNVLHDPRTFVVGFLDEEGTILQALSEEP